MNVSETPEIAWFIVGSESRRILKISAEAIEITGYKVDGLVRHLSLAEKLDYYCSRDIRGVSTFSLRFARQPAVAEFSRPPQLGFPNSIRVTLKLLKKLPKNRARKPPEYTPQQRRRVIKALCDTMTRA